jgi:hypothetical protein
MIDQLSTNVLLIIRHNPLNDKSVLLVAHTAFSPPTDRWDRVGPLSIQGIVDEIILEASLNHPREKESVKDFKRSKEYVNGLEQTNVYLNENLRIEESKCVHLTSPNSIDYNGFRTIEFTDGFRPGSIVVLSVSLLNQMNQSLNEVNKFLNVFFIVHQLKNNLMEKDLMFIQFLIMENFIIVEFMDKYLF